MTIPRPLALMALLPIALGTPGCQTAPSKASGLGTITTVAVTPGAVTWRAVVLSIKNENGEEVYSYLKKGTFQVSTDLPAGAYAITHTCSPSQERYEELANQWRQAKYTIHIRLNAGDLIKYTAEGILTLSGVRCQGKFTAPLGQILSDN